MSISFDLGDDVLWWPSNFPAHLFKGHAESIAEALKMPSGLGDIIEDECEVDLPAFEALVTAAMRRYDETTHPIVRALLSSFIPTAQVLVERAGGSYPKAESQKQESVWAAMRKEHAAYMSRS
ncbi:DUF6086 family protein [Streptomyces sp. HPF1205]|uniref:DUF6086 family protein n=1 Tax=Streptomyces sp. HPF1205 TaxID=2873262 RepID=UPI001CECAAA4|nr:DUF6086 family protein [Streptomyces sp. HPF1205]